MPNRTVVQDANDYRVVIFGSACVGKTSLLMRFIEGTFKDTYSPTVEDTHRQVSLIFLSTLTGLFIIQLKLQRLLLKKILLLKPLAVYETVEKSLWHFSKTIAAGMDNLWLY